MVHAQKTWFHCGFRRVKLTTNVVSGKILFKHICICLCAMKSKTHPLEYLLTRGVNNKKKSYTEPIKSPTFHHVQLLYSLLAKR